MDVAVEDRHRAEALEGGQRLGAVVRAPAPIRINCPQRYVGEDHNRGRSRAAFDVVFEPFELLLTEIAESTSFEIGDVDETDEVHAVGVEAVPTGPLGAASVALAVKFLVRVEQVRFAGDVMK